HQYGAEAHKGSRRTTGHLYKNLINALVSRSPSDQAGAGSEGPLLGTKPPADLLEHFIIC
ncbi:hypothetical protein ACCS78_04750, partial [Rhizobium johnstonii]